MARSMEAVGVVTTSPEVLCQGKILSFSMEGRRFKEEVLASDCRMEGRGEGKRKEEREKGNGDLYCENQRLLVLDQSRNSFAEARSLEVDRLFQQRCRCH